MHSTNHWESAEMKYELVLSLLALWVIDINTAKRCSPPTHIQLQQDTLLSRPPEEVRFTCDFSGTSSDQVLYYWWLLDETNTPLFTYSEVHQIVEVASSYASWQIHETRDFFANGVISKLRMSPNITRKYRLKCEFTTVDQKSCTEIIWIEFEEPLLGIQVDADSIRYQDTPHPAMVMDIKVRMSGSAGVPRVQVLENDPVNDVRVHLIDTMTVTRTHRGFLDVFGTVVFPVSTRGTVVIAVIDAIGRYWTEEQYNIEACIDDVRLETSALRNSRSSEIILSCNIFGVHPDGIEYYFWRRVEALELLFVFSGDHAQIEFGNATEKHIFSENSVDSQLEISACPQLNASYEFFFKTHRKMCRGISQPLLKDPYLTIQLNEDPLETETSEPASLVDVDCAITAAIGSPTFQLHYEGPHASRYRQVEADTTVEPMNCDYFRGRLRAITRMPSTGKLTCLVTDSVGTYSIQTRIVPRAPASCHLNTIAIVTSAMACAILLLLPIVISNIFMRRRAMKARSSLRQEEDTIETSRLEPVSEV